MKVAIIDYGSGNLRSASKSFERAAHESGSDAEIVLTSQVDQVKQADRIVLPGVGAFVDCRSGIHQIAGMWQAIDEAVSVDKKPFLGICVGMQLMAERGHEHSITTGFGWIKGDVRAIEPEDKTLKIPHMGWNTLNLRKPHPLFDGIKTGDKGLHAYFVHSYHLIPEDREDILAEADYGGSLIAAVAKDNMVGTQFHPEKSQELGLRLIANFLSWTP